MTLIRFGGGITEMRGSMGGNTFSRNRYGAYMLARTKPINPNSDAQVNVRACMAFLTDRWSNTLTPVERAAWNLYGSNVVMKNKLSESINLSGFNHYIRSNVEYKNRFGVTLDPGPVVFEIPAADPTFAITASAAAQEYSVTHDAGMDWADEDGAAMMLYQGNPQNGQRNFFGGPWIFMAVIPGINGAPAGSPSAHTVVIPFTEGNRLWMYARIVRADGRLSAPFRTDVIAAA